MSIERKKAFKFYEIEATIVGEDLKVGQKAPEFTVLANDWSTVKALKSTKGKVRILGSLPSINTSVCDRETRRFNQEAASISTDIVILMLSMDLPYSQKNWCSAAGVDRVVTLSDAKTADFAKKYGVLIKEPRVMRRAIFVVDRHDKVVYAAYMPTNRDEPDYAAVLQAAKSALD